jgi:putative addiction module killer protein
LYLLGYSYNAFEIIQTEYFESWFLKLCDEQAQARINVRIRRLSLGNPGDVKPVGSGVSELRIDHGPGYRIYYMQRDQTIIILLCGGDKKSQPGDIQTAIEIAEQLRKENS